MIDKLEEIVLQEPYKIIISNKISKNNEFNKIVIELKIIGKREMFQVEKFTDKQAFHINIEKNTLLQVLKAYMDNEYRQLNAWSKEKEYELKISKKGKVLFNTRRNEKGQHILCGNNKKKQYIIEEGIKVPPLIDLGVMTKDGKVVNSMYDKYRQINKFLEIVEDTLKDFKGEKINIIDFGCGKAYLTFVLYYYLTEIKKIKTNIIGLDLKTTVIKKCNEIAQKYKYENLKFELGDINGYKAKDDVHMVITLHACDTATDFALYNAVTWNALYILSVPCCQHEVNKQIETDELSILTKYGIIKERTSALYTDAIRANALECSGYKTQIMEFIDLEHSPKNLLIRAVKGNISKEKKSNAAKEIENICREFHIEPTIVKLLKINP